MYIMGSVFLFLELSTVAEAISYKLNLIIVDNQLNISSSQNGILLITFNFKMFIAQEIFLAKNFSNNFGYFLRSKRN